MFGFFSCIYNWYYTLTDESVGLPIEELSLSDNSDTFDIPTLTISKMRSSF